MEFVLLILILATAFNANDFLPLLKVFQGIPKKIKTLQKELSLEKILAQLAEEETPSYNSYNEYSRKIPRFKYIEQLKAFRGCLIFCVVAFCLVFGCSLFFLDELYEIVTAPLSSVLPKDSYLIFTNPAEGFAAQMKIALFSSLIVTGPIALARVYAFVYVGLHSSERMKSIWYVILSPVLFCCGVAMVYFYVLPATCAFFLTFENKNASLPLTFQPKISECLTFVFSTIFWSGVIFQLPVAISLLSDFGIVTREKLAAYRKHVIVGFFILAAMITPPDVVSQIALALPMVALYELSIFFCRRSKKSEVYKKRTRKV